MGRGEKREGKEEEEKEEDQGGGRCYGPEPRGQE